MDPAGTGAATVTSSARMRFCACRSSTVRGATGVASAAMRARTSARALRREMRWRAGVTSIGLVLPNRLHRGQATSYRGAMAQTVLDLRGLKCPLPALKARKALAKLSPGDTLV